MTSRLRLPLITCLVVVAFATRLDAAAITITVAEFRWDATTIPGTVCSDPLDLECIASDPVDQSLFSLTGLWDYASVPAPAITGSVSLDDVAIPWLEITLGAGYFDQFQVTGTPLVAATTIALDFLGDTRLLNAVLTAPGFALLSFDYEPPTTPPDPVPEPGTLALLGVGLAALSRSVARRGTGTPQV